MSVLRFLQGLDLVWDDSGPVLSHTDGYRAHPVHFRQGSLDGACGLYAVVMGLALLGDRLEEARIRRALKLLATEDPLLSRGIRVGQMARLVTAMSDEVEFRRMTGRSKTLLLKTCQAVDRNHPVLLGITAVELRHWVTALGYQSAEGGNPHRIFVLDPSVEAPRLSYWNGLLTRYTDRGTVRYRYDNAEESYTNVVIDEAYLLRRKAD